MVLQALDDLLYIVLSYRIELLLELDSVWQRWQIDFKWGWVFVFEELLKLLLGPGFESGVVEVIFCSMICFSYSLEANHRLNAAFSSGQSGCFACVLLCILGACNGDCF